MTPVSFNSPGDAPDVWRKVLLPPLLWVCCLMGGSACAAGDERKAEGEPKGKWEEATLDIGKGAVLSVAISPDGELFAWGRGRSGQAGNGRLAPITLVEARSGKTIKHLTGHAFDVTAVRFVAGGKQLASGDDKGFMCLWDLETGKEASAGRPHERMVRCIRDLPGGKGFATAGNGKIHLWRDSLESPRQSCVVDRILCLDVSFSRDGKTIAACSDEHASVWNCDTGRELASTPRKYDLLTSIDVTQDGKSMLAVTARGNLLVFDYPTLREHSDVRTKAIHERVRAISGTECVIVGSAGRVEVYDFFLKRQACLLSEDDSRGNGGAFTDLDVSVDGAVIAACYDGHMAKVWRRMQPTEKNR